MGKIKYTKNELKAQRDALARFERYLPTLQLKKQQLQVELRQLEARIEEKAAEEESEREQMNGWIKLYSEPVEWESFLAVRQIIRSAGNIAGVSIPVLESVEFEAREVDLFATPAWLDEGLRAAEHLVHLRIERQVLEEQHRRLSAELRTTTQRVNLFEKVKIPESRDHIRVIRIFLGDQQTAAVARSKIAKNKSVEKVRSS
jgi:V/A-type H+/Na+-transporting ATPase subunit D